MMWTFPQGSYQHAGYGMPQGGMPQGMPPQHMMHHMMPQHQAFPPFPMQPGPTNMTEGQQVAGAGGKTRRKRKKRVLEGGPKKPATAFVMFSNQMREQVKADMPGISFTDIGRKLGEMWREMDAETKKGYEDRATEAKDKYMAEKKAWLESKQKSGEGDMMTGTMGGRAMGTMPPGMSQGMAQGMMQGGMPQGMMPGMGMGMGMMPMGMGPGMGMQPMPGHMSGPADDKSHGKDMSGQGGDGKGGDKGPVGANGDAI